MNGGRRIYPIGTTITTTTGTRWELVRVRGPWTCAGCGEMSRRQAWRTLTPGGYTRSRGARCDKAGCRPAGAARQPDGHAEAAQP